MPRDDWRRARAQKLGQKELHQRAEEAGGAGSSSPMIEDRDNRRSKSDVRFNSKKGKKSGSIRAQAQVSQPTLAPAQSPSPCKETSRTQVRFRAMRGLRGRLETELASPLRTIVAALDGAGMRALVVYDPAYAKKTGQPTARIEGVVGPGFEQRTSALRAHLSPEVNALLGAIKKHDLGAIRVVAEHSPSLEIATKESGISWVHPPRSGDTGPTRSRPPS